MHSGNYPPQGEGQGQGPFQGGTGPGYGAPIPPATGGPGGYGGPPGGYGGGPGYTGPPSDVNGTMILVLGILSVLCCQILGPVAWIMGNGQLQAINAAGGNPAYESQRQMVTIGRILGIIGTVFLVLTIILYMFGFAAALTGGRSAVNSNPTFSVPR